MLSIFFMVISARLGTAEPPAAEPRTEELRRMLLMKITCNVVMLKETFY